MPINVYTLIFGAAQQSRTMASISSSAIARRHALSLVLKITITKRPSPDSGKDAVENNPQHLNE